MAVLHIPPALTDEQIIALEAQRGQLDFTGPQGHSDALTLMGNYWNHDANVHIGYMYYLKAYIDKVG